MLDDCWDLDMVLVKYIWLKLLYAKNFVGWYYYWQPDIYADFYEFEQDMDDMLRGFEAYINLEYSDKHLGLMYKARYLFAELLPTLWL